MAMSQEGKKQDGNPFQQDPTLLERLATVSRTYIHQQRVVYAESGAAFKIAVDHLETPEVQEFLEQCFAGVVSIFLDQRAYTVRANLLMNFDTVLYGASKIILWDLKTNHSVQYLETLKKLMCSERLYYNSQDADVHAHDASTKVTLANAKGPKTRRQIIELFDSEGGFDLLVEMLKGKIPVADSSESSDEDDEDSGSSNGNMRMDDSKRLPQSDHQGLYQLSSEQVRLILDPFITARDVIGNQRAVHACHLAVTAVERMSEETLKTQRSVELNKLHLLLKTVLVDDERLKDFLCSLSLKTFTSKAFQLRKLGLDLMCKLIGESQKQDLSRLHQQNYDNNQPVYGSSGSVSSSSSSSNGSISGGDDPASASVVVKFDSNWMKQWVIKNEVLEKLFGSTESVHPALVGRSKKLLEFMARTNAIQEKHVDLIFKSCFGCHDSVRGAVQTLLAELTVDVQVRPETSAYILKCAKRFVAEHRSDMQFFVDKLMQAGLASSGYQRPLVHCNRIVLKALLDLIWTLLLASGYDVHSPQRGQLIEYMIEVLRLPNARVLRTLYISICIEMVQHGSQKGYKDQLHLQSRAITAYEMLQKVISLFDVNPTNSKGSSSSNSKNGGLSDPVQFFQSDYRMSELDEGDEDDFLASLEEVGDNLASLLIHKTTTASGQEVRNLLSQSELIVELEKRYKILELVVNETKSYEEASVKHSLLKSKNHDQLLVHMQNLQSRLDFLQFCVSRSSLMLGFDLVHQLWESLNEPLEREVCMVWLRQVAVVDTGLKPGLSPGVTRQVFSSLLCGEMEFRQLSEPGFKCFSAFFLDVNRAEDILDGEVVNYNLGSAGSTSSSILNTHARYGASSKNLNQQLRDENNNSTNITSPSSTPTGEDPLASPDKKKKKKKGRRRGSFFSEFFPSLRSNWTNSMRNATNKSKLNKLKNGSPGGNSPGTSSPSESLSPSSAMGGSSSSFYSYNNANNDGPNGAPTSSSVGDTRVDVVKRPDVVGMDTLWRIVESAPSGTAARAMDLLLQVQCRIEALADSIKKYKAEADDAVFPSQVHPNATAEKVTSGLQRRIEFLDRTFSLLETTSTASSSSQENTDAENDRVQRCIRLISLYLQLFPQASELVSHASPRGPEVELTIHHDRILLFTKRDVGKLIQVAVTPRASTAAAGGAGVTRRARTVRFLNGIIVDFDPETEEHIIWFVDGRSIRRDMSDLYAPGRQVGKSSERTYNMQPRNYIRRNQLPLQPVEGVEMPPEVLAICHAYRPISLRMKDKATLDELTRTILQKLVKNSKSALNVQTISVSAQIFPKQQPQQQQQQQLPYGDYEHEKLLIGQQNMLSELLPPVANSAGVKSSSTSKPVVRHVLHVSCVDNYDVDQSQTLTEVEDESELPSVLITAKDSKYFNTLIGLLDNHSISDVARVELWELLMTLPTGQALLHQLKTSYENINWDEELRPSGPHMLRAIYVLMIVDRLLGNEANSSTSRSEKGSSEKQVLNPDDDDDDDDDMDEEDEDSDEDDGDDNTIDAENHHALRAKKTDSDDGRGGKSFHSVWRSCFLKTQGFQDVAQLLGTIITTATEDSWFWYWQRSVSLPVVLKVIRFCVQGSLGGLMQSGQTTRRASGELSRVEMIQLEDDRAASRLQFSPTSKSSISKDTDLRLLSTNLSRLIVIAHRATCSQTDECVDDDGGRTMGDNGEYDEDDEEDDDEEEEDEEHFFGDDKFDEEEAVLRMAQEQANPVIDEKDEAMVEVLVDAIQIAFRMIGSHKALGIDFLSSQIQTSTTSPTGARRGANTIVDVLILSRFPIVRELLCDLMVTLCDDSAQGCRIIQDLALMALKRTPRNCNTCDDFFAFIRAQITREQFSVDHFVSMVMDRLVHYPRPPKHYLRREAKLLGSFNPQLRGYQYKPRPGMPPPKVNQETPQYKDCRTLTLALLDNTVIGLLDLMELIVMEGAEAVRTFATCRPLLESIFFRFLMAIPNATNKGASAIATLPDVRVRCYSLLKVLAESNMENLAWLVQECTQFVSDTPVPLTRAQRFDWSFKPIDYRKSPTGFVGLINQGATCYQNSVLQQLFMAPKLSSWILHAAGVLPSLAREIVLKKIDDDEDDEEEEDEDDDSLIGTIGHVRDNKKNRLLRALQRTFVFLKDSDKRYYNPTNFVNESASLKLMDGHLSQNDAIEFYSRLVDYMEEVTQGREQCARLQDMLYVRTCTMNVRNCDGKHRTESEVGTPFLTLNVRSGMAGPTLGSLDDALESWFKAEKLSGLECEICNANNKDQRFDADQVKCFSKLPHILVVQLQRFDFDYEIMQPTKLNHRVSFEHRIDLYRFTKDAVMSKFDEDANKKKSDGDEQPSDDVTSSSNNRAGEDGGDEDGANPAATATSNADENRKDDGCCDRGDGVKKPKTVYELKGVVVHQGSGANFGHYYSFIKDRKSGQWFRFDDERVTPFDVRNLEDECFGGSGSNDGQNLSWNPAQSSKFKPYGGAKDNNAYLLLYELVDDDDDDDEEEGEKKCKEQERKTSAVPNGNSKPLSFAFAGRLVCALSKLLRKARLSINAKTRIKKIEVAVWEDNQRTLRHGLVMVPAFMDFIHQLLSIPLNSDSVMNPITPQIYNAVIRMGLVVTTKATIRVASQKSRLRGWFQTLKKLLDQCTSQEIVGWFLQYLVITNVREETLEPCLQLCIEKGARDFIKSITVDILERSYQMYHDEPENSDSTITSSLIPFVDVVIEMLPEGPVNCKFMSPYFSVWKSLTTPLFLHQYLCDEDILTRLITMYRTNDPSITSGASPRGRGMSLDANQGLQNVNAEADFSALVDAITFMVLRTNTEKQYLKETRVDGFYDDDFSDQDDGDEELEYCDDDEEENMDTMDLSDHSNLEMGTLMRYLAHSHKLLSHRYARGFPLQREAVTHDLIDDDFGHQLFRCNPGPGAQLLAYKAKGSLQFSQKAIQDMAHSITQHARLVNCANASMEAIKRRIKDLCHAIRAIATIIDGCSHERGRSVVEECLNAAITSKNDIQDIQGRRDYNRSVRYASNNVYLDNESDESYDLHVYAIYSIAKLLMQVFPYSAPIRFWMNEHRRHWIPWLPEWLDHHSYERILHGNMDVSTRSATKGSVVQQLRRAAFRIQPDVKFKPKEPKCVSIEIGDAGLKECNGTYIFDGYFTPGESQQIDTISPKFVKMANGRPLNVYRCIVKDKQYTWYVSELSARPGTNNDVDFYNSHRDNPSSMPPEAGWLTCGKGVKPPPKLVKIVRSKFTPEYDPCVYMNRPKKGAITAVNSNNSAQLRASAQQQQQPIPSIQSPPAPPPSSSLMSEQTTTGRGGQGPSIIIPNRRRILVDDDEDEDEDDEDEEDDDDIDDDDTDSVRVNDEIDNDDYNLLQGHSDDFETASVGDEQSPH